MVYVYGVRLFKGRHWNQPATISEKALTKYKLGSLSVSRFPCSPVWVWVFVWASFPVWGNSRQVSSQRALSQSLAGMPHAPVLPPSMVCCVCSIGGHYRGSVLLDAVCCPERRWWSSWRREKAGERVAEIVVFRRTCPAKCLECLRSCKKWKISILIFVSFILLYICILFHYVSFLADLGY